MKVIFIRHGQTPGNAKKQYIGSTDESLSEEGKSILKAKHYPIVEQLIVSPMKRCQETAAIIYPGKDYIVAEQLRECDFGLFERKAYEELKDLKAYQEWLASKGALPFPNGESAEAFKKRCCEAFLNIMAHYQEAKSIAFVVHGGTIMAILEAYGYPKKEFYDYQVKNGSGYLVEYDCKRQEMTSIVLL